MPGWFQVINEGAEKRFDALGRFTASNSKLVLALSFFVGLLGLGLLSAETEGDLYALWIESDSRLHDERAFRDEYFSSTETRSESVALHSTDRSDLINAEALTYVLDLVTHVAEDITFTYDDVVYHYEDICSRPPNPAELNPFLTKVNETGFPCTRMTVLDCFAESSVDLTLFAINDIHPVATAALAGMGLADPFPAKPSIYNATHLDVTNSCSNWVNFELPENVIMGGVERDAAGDFTKVATLQTVWSTMGIDTLGKQLATARCEAESSCSQECSDDFFECAMEPCFIGAVDCMTDCAMQQVTDCLTPVVIAQVTSCIGGGGEFNNCSLAGVTCGEEIPTYLGYAAAGIAVDAPESCTDDTVLGAGACVYAGAECGDFFAGAIDDPSSCSDASMVCFPECADNATACTNLCYASAVPCALTCAGTCSATHPVLASDTSSAEAIIEGWEAAFVDAMAVRQADMPGSLKLEYFAGRSAKDLVEEATQGDAGLIAAGYIAMLCFASLSLFRYNDLTSRVTVGFMGVVLVVISVVASFGVCGIFGIPITPSQLQVLPFLALGLGVDDMFVLAFAFRYSHKQNTETMLATVMREAGASISLTSLCNMIVFAIGASMPLPAVSYFSLAAMVVVIFNYFMMIFGFSAVLALNADRIRNQRKDVFCCFAAVHDPTDLGDLVGEDDSTWNYKVAEMLTALPVRVSLIVGFLAFLGVGIYGVGEVELGLPLVDVVPEDHYSSGFLKLRSDYYGAYGGQLTTGMNINGNLEEINYSDPDVLRKIVETELLLDAIPLMSDQLPAISRSWVDTFTQWENAYHPEALSDVPYPVDETLMFPTQDSFYAHLAEFLISSSGLSANEQIVFSEDQTRITASSIPLFFVDAYTADDYIGIITETVEICDQSGLPLFVSGFIHNLFEQYINVSGYLLSNMMYAGIGIALASCLFLYHPAAVFIMIMVIAAVMVEVYGMLSFMGLKVNGVCAINMVLAVGVTVECTAHITRVFMITPGDRVHRAQRALSLMLAPVVFGGMSTFLGVFFMVFATFPYFRRYFFDMYVLIIFIGLGNGILFLPAVLSFIGPQSLEAVSTKDCTEVSPRASV